MAIDNDPLSPRAEATGSHPLTEVFRFLQVVKLRRNVLLVCLAAAGVLGAIYYLTTPKIYESAAEVLVLQIGSEGLKNQGNSSQRGIQDYMPTYQKILTSDRVLDATIKALPPAYLAELKTVPKEKWIATLRTNLNVGTSRGANILEMRYRSKSPRIAFAMVQSLLASYTRFVNEMHKNNAGDMLESLTREKAMHEQKLQEKERELVQLKRRSEVLFSGKDDMTNVVVSRVVKLNEALVEAQRTTVEARSFLNSVESAIASGGDIQQLLQQAIDTVGDSLMLREMGLGTDDNQVLAYFERQLVDAQADLRNKLAHFGPKHPQVRELEDKIKQTHTYLLQRKQQVAASVRETRESELRPKLSAIARQKFNQAANHEQSIRAEFEREKSLALSLNNQLAQIQIAELDIKRMRSFYDLLLDRIRDVDLGRESGGMRTSVVSEPRLSSIPVAPRMSFIGTVALFCGTAIGLLLIYILDALDDRFRSPEELKLHLRFPILALIAKLDGAGGLGIANVEAFRNPNGLAAEAYRTLRSAISFSAEDTGRLVITSTEPGDGKTTTLANLAVTYAQARKRTLLIDADMRRPGMTAMLELKGQQGLSQILRDDRTIADCAPLNVYAMPLENLDVIPAGPRPGNPAELLQSERFSDLLAWAETQYDQILIDAPPILAVADPAIIGRLVDGCVLVVRPDKNRRRVVIRAGEALVSAGVTVVGMAVNHLGKEMTSDAYSYGYGHGYGHDSHPQTADDEEHQYQRAA